MCTVLGTRAVIKKQQHHHNFGEFPGGPVVRTQHFQCRMLGNPDSTWCTVWRGKKPTFFFNIFMNQWFLCIQEFKDEVKVVPHSRTLK